MANTDSISSTLEQDVGRLVFKSQQAESLLRCALAKLDEFCGEDREGSVFHSLQTIEAAAEKLLEITRMDDELHILDRVKAMEGVQA